MPGSKKASQECFEAIVMSIPHAVGVLRNNNQLVEQVHKGLQGAGDDVSSPENYLPIPMESKVIIWKKKNSFIHSQIIRGRP